MVITGLPGFTAASKKIDPGSQVEFVLIAEGGLLEKQAILLCRSIRQFGGVLSSSAITVVSPRKGRRPSCAALREIDRLCVEFVALDIDAPCPEYGPSFKVHALAHVERRSGPPIVVQVDSDSLFVAEPTCFLRIGGAAARPVDVKGMCTAGSLDTFDQYWRAACDLFHVDYDRVPLVRTTVDRVLVRASYNGGLFAVRRASGIFGQTEEFFQILVQTNHKPWNLPGFNIRSGSGTVSEIGSAFWGTSQMALSLAAVKREITVEILSQTYNFPLHFLDDVVPEVGAPLIHIHYHWLASGGTGETSAMLDARLPLAAGVREWLRSQLPLRADV
jgi:hypothetical protein